MRNNVNVQVYSSCNCNCSFCMLRDPCHTKIDPSFVLKYLEEHPEITKVVLTGGEPTLAIDEYAEIIKNLNTDKYNTILQTNGWWGNNEKIKDIIRQYPPKVVHLSVDSAKQQYIDLDTIIEAYNFLETLDIDVCVVNHHSHDNEQEYEYYENIFPGLIYGTIEVDDGEHEFDCGTALLADGRVGRLNIRGWEVKADD